MKSNKRASAQPSDFTATGFTLIELMVAVAVISVLAMIAIPNYADYVKRSRIIDATSRLSDFRVRMEQYFLDNRTYLKNAQCGIDDQSAIGSEAFNITCTAGAAPPTYKVTATGIAAKGMQRFKYTINESNTKTTEDVPDGWNMDNRAICWITRKDGNCG